MGRFNVDKIILKVIRDANIAYKHFEKGNLDSFALVQPEFWHNKAKGKLYDNGYIEKFVFYNDMPRSSSGFFLNLDSEILKSKDVRIALAHSLNFQRVIDTVLRGDYERLNAFHTGYGEYTNDQIQARPYDLTKANKLLDSSGWQERGGDGIRIKEGQRLSIKLVYGRKEHSERWSILKQDAIKAGIELNLGLQDSSSHYKTIMQKQHQMASLGWSTGFRPAFWQHFHSENAHKPQTNNITNTDNLCLFMQDTIDREDVPPSEQEVDGDIERVIGDKEVYGKMRFRKIKTVMVDQGVVNHTRFYETDAVSSIQSYHALVPTKNYGDTWGEVRKKQLA